ncbi:MAG: hypothetical protein HQL38_19170 [Alphaproteobacteria bacterium]|nr:hypothetical protein [Alphaproteobacteria bacterium]
MKIRDRQMELFRKAPPMKVLTPDQFSRVLPLIEILLKEIVTGKATTMLEGGHDDQDHA